MAAPEHESVMRGPSGRYLTWTVVLFVASIVLTLSAWYYQAWVVPRQLDREIWATIDSLAARRPASMTRGQWASAVAWTHNLHGNSLLPFQARATNIKRFRAELEARLARDVDMATISWIWDQYAGLTPAGKWYWDNFKQQMLDEIREARPDDNPWGMDIP